MHDQSEWFTLFSGFWWLLFPLAWAIGQLVKNWMRHNRAKETLAVLKSYADQGKDAPPELLAALRDPEKPRAEQGGGYGRYGWIPVFLFGALACGFVLLAIWPIDESVPRVMMLFVALIMIGLFLGNLMALKSRHRQDRISPP
jgi:hypothetical protein